MRLNLIVGFFHWAICGRIKSDYRYSTQVVYNNYPWPHKQTSRLEETAKAILECRDKYNSVSLSDLYDPVFMPIDLRKAHEENNAAVMEAYGFHPDMTEADIVAELMKLYQQLVSNLH